MSTQIKNRIDTYTALRAETKQSLVGVEEADKTENAISTALHPPDVAPLNELEISLISSPYLSQSAAPLCVRDILHIPQSSIFGRA